MTALKTFAELKIGSVINYNNSFVGKNCNYVIIYKYSNKFGDYCKLLNLDNYDIEEFSQETQLWLSWSIVKEF